MIVGVSRSIVRALGLGAAAVALLGAAPRPLRFEQVFGTIGEPARLHFRVLYQGAGGVHRLEVWRDGTRRLRRDTDGGALTTFVLARPADGGYRLILLDARRKLRTDVDRDNLYRQGNFTDWFDLAHGLRFPKANYTLALTRRGPQTAASVRPCTWYDLNEGGRVIRICWDKASRLPLLITTEAGRLVWRVTAIDTAPLPPATFAIRDQGYIRNDADRDMEKD